METGRRRGEKGVREKEKDRSVGRENARWRKREERSEGGEATEAQVERDEREVEIEAARGKERKRVERSCRASRLDSVAARRQKSNKRSVRSRVHARTHARTYVTVRYSAW